MRVSVAVGHAGRTATPWRTRSVSRSGTCRASGATARGAGSSRPGGWRATLRSTGLKGVTTNPAIHEKATGSTRGHDAGLATLLATIEARRAAGPGAGPSRRSVDAERHEAR
jgi:hypothetical protein